MSRLQLALNVTNLDEAVAFYSRLFATAPAKVKPGYANFAIADPPLKLVLFEGPEGATINHLGVEVDSAEEVVSAQRRLAQAELKTTGVDETTCCFAEKAETWVADPDGVRWEWYVKTGDAEQLHNTVVGTLERDGDAKAAPDPCCA
jgi:catechol 2,3-dioxygenase-like lactoylglutathione lyase family enzyme